MIFESVTQKTTFILTGSRGSAIIGVEAMACDVVKCAIYDNEASCV